MTIENRMLAASGCAPTAVRLGPARTLDTAPAPVGTKAVVWARRVGEVGIRSRSFTGWSIAHLHEPGNGPAGPLPSQQAGYGRPGHLASAMPTVPVAFALRN